MTLNDRITQRFEMVTHFSKQDILESLAYYKRNFSWTDLLVFESIDFKEIRIKDDRLEIVRSPAMLNPFRPYGKITIDINDNGEKTSLKCEIIPYNGNYPLIIGLAIGALSLWTLIAFAFGQNLNILIMVVASWIGVGLIMFLKYLYTKYLLIYYSKRTIEDLIERRTASR